MLGYATMEMVKRYLSIAQADLDKNHKLLSPVDNWRLLNHPTDESKKALV